MFTTETTKSLLKMKKILFLKHLTVEAGQKIGGTKFQNSVNFMEKGIDGSRKGKFFLLRKVVEAVVPAVPPLD